MTSLWTELTWLGRPGPVQVADTRIHVGVLLDDGDDGRVALTLPNGLELIVAGDRDEEVPIELSFTTEGTSAVSRSDDQRAVVVRTGDGFVIRSLPAHKHLDECEHCPVVPEPGFAPWVARRHVAPIAVLLAGLPVDPRRWRIAGHVDVWRGLLDAGSALLVERFGYDDVSWPRDGRAGTIVEAVSGLLEPDPAVTGPPGLP